MFLIDRRKKMVRKIAIIIPVFFLCLGLNSCKSLFEPRPDYEYRFQVEVIYTTVDVDHANDSVSLRYMLYDPAKTFDMPDGFYRTGTIRMDKIGENKYRCILPSVFIQPPGNYDCHRIDIHHTTQSEMQDERVDLQEVYIQGAYEQETREAFAGIDFFWICIGFKMSNN